jgi:transketolase
MLNQSLKLNPKIFSDDAEKKATRQGFGEGLVIAGEQNKNVVCLCADMNRSTFMHLFAEKFPERFVQVGIAEQNLVTVASGLAAMGKIPFTTSLAAFSPGRNWEQIRTTIAYNDRPVKIMGSYAGFSTGPDGGSHQILEDLALMRTIPNMIVLSPCDAEQAKKTAIEAAKIDKPVYIRLFKSETPVITTEDTPFEIGKAQILFAPPMTAQVGIIATGPLIHKALVVAQNFAEKGIAIKVLNVHSLRPLDFDAVIDLAKEAGAIVSVEEHQIMGGLGSAIAEVLVQNYPVPMELIGVHDKFGESGKPEELIEKYGMGVLSIERAVEKVIERKNK